MHPVDAFAEALVSPSATPRLLLDLETPPTPDLLATLRSLTASDAALWTVRVPPASLRATRVALPDLELLAEPPSTRVWDAGVAIGPRGESQLARLTYAAPRVLELGAQDATGLVEAARAPVDLADLGARWDGNASRLARTRALDPAPPALWRRIAHRLRRTRTRGANG
jgi:hypothetical protein